MYVGSRKERHLRRTLCILFWAINVRPGIQKSRGDDHKKVKNKPGGSKKPSESLDQKEWIVQFRKYLRANPSYDRLFQSLIREGCQETSLLALLHCATYPELNSAKSFKQETRRLMKDARVLASETAALAQRVRGIISFFLGNTVPMDDIRLRGPFGFTAVVTEAHFACLSEFLQVFSGKLLSEVKHAPHVNLIEERGPELMALWVYLRCKASATYLNLAHLLECAGASVERDFNKDPEAIRKVLERYRRRQPGAFEKIVNLIARYSDAVKANRGSMPDIAEYILNGIRTDTYWKVPAKTRRKV